MEIKRGNAGSPGLATGTAIVLGTQWFRSPQSFIEKDHQTEELGLPRLLIAAALRDAHLNGKPAALDTTKVHAFATEAGGRASHTAIMAGALEIPAVVGLGKFVTDVSGGDDVIVDGTRGVVILNPDEDTRKRYERARKSFRTF